MRPKAVPDAATANVNAASMRIELKVLGVQRVRQTEHVYDRMGQRHTHPRSGRGRPGPPAPDHPDRYCAPSIVAKDRRPEGTPSEQGH